jgi:hypothetical protein
MQPLGVGRDGRAPFKTYMSLIAILLRRTFRIHMTYLLFYKIRCNVVIRLSIRVCDLKELIPCFCGLSVCTSGSKCMFRDICVCVCILELHFLNV